MLSDRDGLKHELRWLRPLSIHLWMFIQFILTQVEYLASLPHAIDRRQQQALFVRYVRKIIIIGNAIEVPPPDRIPHRLRALGLLFRSWFYTTCGALIIVITVYKEEIYGNVVSKEDLGRLAHFAELALQYHKSAYSVKWASTERSEARVRRKGSLQRAGLHTMLGAVHLHLIADDPARQTEIALEHLASASKILQKLGDAQALWNLANVWRKLGEVLLSCPASDEHANAKIAEHALSSAKEITARYLDVVERLPEFVYDKKAWRNTSTLARMRYAAKYPIFGRPFNKNDEPNSAVLGMTLPHKMATIDWHLGIVYRKLGNLEKAVEHFDLALAERWNVDSRAAIQIDRGLAYLELAEDRTDNLKQALAEFNKVLKVRKELDSVKIVAFAIMGSVHVYLAQLENADKARIDKFAVLIDWSVRELRMVMRLARERSMIQLCAEAAFLLGRVYALRRNFAHAFQALALVSRLADRTRRRARTMRLKDYWAVTGTTLYEYLVTVAKLYPSPDTEADPPAVFARTRVARRSALTFSERGRVVFLQEELRNRELLPRGATNDDPKIKRLFEMRRAWHLAEIQMRERDMSMIGGVDAFLDDERRVRRNELEAQYFGELQAARQRFGDFAYDPDQPILPAAFAQIQSAIDILSEEQETVLVEYHVTERNIFVFVLFPRRKPYPFTFFFRVLHISPEELDEAAEQWAQRAPNVGPAATPVSPATLEEWKGTWMHWGKGCLPQTLLRLGELAAIPHEVIRKWEATTERRVKRIIVAPHRFLHLVPLHAIELPSGERWGDNVVIQYVPSASVLCRLLNRTEGHPASIAPDSSGKNIVGVAWSRTDRPLAWAQREVRIVANILGGQVIEGQGATPQRVIEMIRDADYVHFACHGVHDDNNPLDGGLILASEERVGHGEQREAKLTLGEIFARVYLPRSPVVVLSACQTGITKVGRINDDYIGLPAGFLYAGARMVVGTLWPVDDLATSLLIGKMAQEIGAGVSSAEALWRAQQWLRTLPTAVAVNEIMHMTPAEADGNQAEQIREYCRWLQRSEAWEPFPFSGPYWWAGFVANGIG
jgi:CHAT domain-containing protein/tetratricopeptide (TPR) repeat protein